MVSDCHECRMQQGMHWYWCKTGKLELASISDQSPKGTDPKGLDSEAARARAEGNAKDLAA